MTHRFRLSLAALTFTLAAFALVPSEAKAAQVMCSNEYGSCEVQNSPSFITCSCVDESSTGGTGGNDYEGMTEAELMAVCEAELSWCQPQDTTTTDGTTTFGTSDTGTDTGDATSTSDTGDATSTSDTGDATSTSGETGGSTSTSGDTASTGGDTSSDGTEGGSTEGDTNASTEGTTSDSGGGTEGDAAGSEGGSEGDATGGADEAEGGDAGIDEGKGCSVANEPGYGVLALFGMLGLFGLRSRRND